MKMKLHKAKDAHGKVPAKFWMHCEFLLVDGGKMSKSLGNTYLVQDIIDKGYEALAFKMMCFTSHYRNKLNFTWEALESSQNALNRLREGYKKHNEGNEEVEESIIQEYKTKFQEAINDDLNIPVAMSVIWDVVKNPNKSKKLAKLLLNFDEVLGVDIQKESEEKTLELPEEIKELIEKRKEARLNKDWASSDLIRDELKEKGYVVKDTKEGMTVERF